MNSLNHILIKITLAVCLAFFGGFAFGQTSSFTYQGRLKDNNLPASGSYQMQFGLFDAPSGGSQIGAMQTNAAVTVTNGIFAVNLTFGGAAFGGADRYLEVSVFSAAANAFLPLTPRQQIMSAPYSVRSLNAATSDTAANALSLGGTAADQFVVTTDPRMTDPRPPTAGSTAYIQNTAVPQAASNFNISGNGVAGGSLTANAVTTATQYNVGSNRVLSVAGAANVFAGVGAGSANVGNTNSFVGSNAGNANTSGNFNSFFGASSGGLNTTGSSNAFFGSNAGAANTTGRTNAFLVLAPV
ncbi:MAG: hypothetical protein ABL952_14875 [Pyrinomonadaceae bacterium]